MNSPRRFLLLLVERFVGVIVLVVLGPTLLLACLLIRATSDGPVVLMDEFPASDGSMVRSYRFRTTGTGSLTFRAIGRFFQKTSIDEFPVFWSLARGDIRLRDVSRCFRRR